MIAYQADLIGKVTVFLMKFLNEGIYSLINSIFKIFLNLANTTLFSNDMIHEFLGRIYVIVGILMLFKLAFSLLSAIVNPDALVDKEKGMQKLIPRTIVVLMMLVFTPTVFDLALEWQGDIAMAVPRIILGTTTNSSELSTTDQGEELATAALKAFIQENDECSDSGKDKQSIAKLAKDVPTTLELVDQRCDTENKQYMFRFNGFVSMIVGIALVVLLASYSIDMGIRVIKIGVLRLLAPIPIISYIDPKSAKSGSFSNFAKECGNTYAELFIKLTVLYFALYILSGIASGSGRFQTPSGLDGSVQGIMTVFLILAVVFFMGKASEFICNILGFKKPDNKGGWLKAITGFSVAGAMGAGMVSGALTNFRGTLASQKARGVGTNYLSALGSGLLGAGTGLWVTGSAAASAQRGKMGAALGAMYKRNAAYSQAAAEGATLFGKAGAGVQRAVTGRTTADQISGQIKSYEAYQKAATQVKSRVSDETVKSSDTYGELIKGSGYHVNYKDFEARMQTAISQRQNEVEYEALDSSGHRSNQRISITEARKQVGYLKSTNEADYLRSQIAGRTFSGATIAADDLDTELLAYVNTANRAGHSLKGVNQVNATDSMKTLKDNIKTSNIRVQELNADYSKASANDSASKPK